MLTTVYSRLGPASCWKIRMAEPSARIEDYGIIGLSCISASQSICQTYLLEWLATAKRNGELSVMATPLSAMKWLGHEV